MPEPRVSRLIAAVLIGLAAMLITAGTLPAQLPVIELRALSRTCFATGQSAPLSIASGNHTAGVRELVFSHPGLQAKPLNDDNDPLTGEATSRDGHFRLSVAADVPPGRYDVRAVGRFGVSNPRTILVAQQVRHVPDAGHDTASATPLDLDAVYCRAVTPQHRDVYQLAVSAGQRYRLDLAARGLDSRLLGSVSVIDAEGRTRQSAIGSDTADVSLDWTAPRDETLFVAVQDALFRGGAEFHYGLSVVTPEAAHSGPTASGPLAALRVHTPDSVTVDDAPAKSVPEQAEPIELTLPAKIEATFDSRTDADSYRCALRQNEAVAIEIVSERLGQPTDARLTVEQGSEQGSEQGGEQGSPGKWKRVATADDSQTLGDAVVSLASNDPRLRFQPPADGVYRITVTDLDTGRALGDVQRYELSVAPPEPTLALLAFPVYPHRDPAVVRPAGVGLMRGDARVVRVFALRENVDGAIEVTATGLPPGLHCPPARIAANQTQTDLVITADEEIDADWSRVRVLGKLLNDSASDPVTADIASVVWEREPYRPSPATRLTDALLVATQPLDTVPLSLRAGSDSPLETAKGSKVDVPIRVRRRDGGKGQVVLRAQNLPPGVKAGDLTIPGDQQEASWTLEIGDKVAEGTYTFWGQGETKVKFTVDPQRLERATKRRERLQKLRDAPEQADDRAQIEAAIKAINQQIEQLKNETKPRDFTIHVPTSLITIQVK